MSKLNFYEVDEAENILEVGFEDDEYDYQQLLMLAKYYRWIVGYGEKRIRKALVEFCNDNLSYFNEVVNRKLLNDVVKKAMGSRPRKQTRIPITRKEIEKIRSIRNFKYEKILFTMLFLSRYLKLYPASEKSGKPEHFGYFLYESQKEHVISLSGLRISIDTLSYIFNDFFVAGLINAKFTKFGARYDLLYSDDSDVPTIFVEDLENPTKHYVEYCNGEKMYCEKCGKEIEKTNNKKKMCKECFDIDRHEYQVKWMQNKRKKKNVDK